MCKLNEELRQLALEAKNYPLGSWKRKVVIDKLFIKIQKSGQLYYPPPKSSALTGQLYRECCSIALNNILLYIYKKIELYRPEKEVLAWVNYLLKTRFIDAEQELRGRDFNVVPMNLQDLFRDSSDRTDDNSFSLESELQPYYQKLDERAAIAKSLQEIEEDAKNILRSKYAANLPQANLQHIALKLREGYSLTEIAAELSIPISTLHGFWQKNKHFVQSFFET